MKFQALLALLPLILLLILVGDGGVRGFAMGGIMILGLSFLWSLGQYFFHKVGLKGSWGVVFPGEEAKQEIVVSNHGLFPLWVKAEDQVRNLDQLGTTQRLYHLDPGREGRWSYTVKGMLRGRHEVGPLITKGHDPLGFFPWQRLWDQYRHILILPTVSSVSGLPQEGQSLGRHHSTSIESDPHDIRYTRPYEPGDEPRYLDLRSTALTGKLHTRVLGSTRHHESILFINLCSDDYPVRRRSALFERVINVASSIVVHQLNRGIEVWASLLGQEGSALLPGEQILPILAESELVSQKGTLEVTMSQIPTAPRDIYYLGPPTSPELTDQLIVLSQMGYRVWPLFFGLSQMAWERGSLKQVWQGDDDGPIDFRPL